MRMLEYITQFKNKQVICFEILQTWWKILFIPMQIFFVLGRCLEILCVGRRIARVLFHIFQHYKFLSNWIIHTHITGMEECFHHFVNENHILRARFVICLFIFAVGCFSYSVLWHKGFFVFTVFSLFFFELYSGEVDGNHIYNAIVVYILYMQSFSGWGSFLTCQFALVLIIWWIKSVKWKNKNKICI